MTKLHVLSAFAVYIFIRADARSVQAKESSMVDSNFTVMKIRNVKYLPLSEGFAYYTIGYTQGSPAHYPHGWPFKLDRRLVTPPKVIREYSYMHDQLPGRPARPSDQAAASQESILKGKPQRRAANEDTRLPQRVYEKQANQAMRANDLSKSRQNQLYEPQVAGAGAQFTDFRFANDFTVKGNASETTHHLDLDSSQSSHLLEQRARRDADEATYPNREAQLFYAQLQYHYNQLLEKAKSIEQLVQLNQRYHRDGKLADEDLTESGNKSKRSAAQTKKVVSTTARSTEDVAAVLPEIYDLFLNSGGENLP